MTLALIQAMEIAREYVRQDVVHVRLNDLSAWPYNFDSATQYLFAVPGQDAFRVGGTRHIAVSKLTGTITDCGLVGE